MKMFNGGHRGSSWGKWTIVVKSYWKDTWDLSTESIPMIQSHSWELWKAYNNSGDRNSIGKSTFHKTSCFAQDSNVYFPGIIRHYRIMDWYFVFVLVIGMFVFENLYINFLFLLVWYKLCLTLEIIIHLSTNTYLMPWETSMVLSPY